MTGDENAGLSVLILGARSDIGLAIADHYARIGARLVLAARSPERIEADADNLRLRHGGPVHTLEFDVLDVSKHGAFLDGIGFLPDIVVCVVGLLGDQAVSERDAATAERVMQTNYVAPSLLIGEIGNRMEARGRGTIVGISSVAGDRGRASNYVYGSAKAGFTAFLSGLRARLSRTPVRVITVKPGFVATRMTAGLKLPARLTAQPAELANAIARAAAGRNDVVYVRPIWRLIMTIIVLLPEGIFKKLKM